MACQTSSATAILIGLIGLATLGGTAQAGVLSGVPALYGPGLSQGVPTGETVDVNNDNVGVGNPNRISLVGINIVGLGPIDILVPVANSPGASGTTEYFIELGSATNKTESAWNGFVIELGSGLGEDFLRLSELAIPGVSGLDFDTPDRDPAVTSPDFLNITHEADLITFSGGIVEIDAFASGQNFSIDVPDKTVSSPSYDFTIRLQALPVLGTEGDFDQDGDVDGADFLAWQRNPNLGSLADWQANFSQLEGDFDQDGDVDGADFLTWQRNPNLGSLADWQTNYGQWRGTSEGDFDQDGDVDGADFLAWQRNPNLGGLANWQTHYGQGNAPLSNLVAVPEPTGVSLLAVAVLLCATAKQSDS